MSTVSTINHTDIMSIIIIDSESLVCLLRSVHEVAVVNSWLAIIATCYSLSSCFVETDDRKIYILDNLLCTIATNILYREKKLTKINWADGQFKCEDGRTDG